MPRPTATLLPNSVMPSPVQLITARDATLTHARVREAARYVRVRSGVFALRSSWNALKPWERYLARVHAFAMRHPDAVFVLESAAALRGLPLFGEPRDIHIQSFERSRSRRFGDVVVHTRGYEPAVDAASGLHFTSLADTAVDLMRVLPPAFGLAMGDAAVRIGGENLRATMTGIADALHATTRGDARLRWLWPRLDGRAESVAESISRAAIEWLGFESPEVQYEFSYEGFDDRSDFFWLRRRIVGETDGYAKYLADTPEETVASIVAEKKREDRLRRHTDGFARWDYKDAINATPLLEKLLAAGLPLARPGQPAMLATLKHNPRSLPWKPGVGAGTSARNREPGETPIAK